MYIKPVPNKLSFEKKRFFLLLSLESLSSTTVNQKNPVTEWIPWIHWIRIFKAHFFFPVKINRDSMNSLDSDKRKYP